MSDIKIRNQRAWAVGSNSEFKLLAEKGWGSKKKEFKGVYAKHPTQTDTCQC